MISIFLAGNAGDGSLNLVANHDITKSSKPARLAIIQQYNLVQQQINITKPIYDEISKYSQKSLANFKN